MIDSYLCRSFTNKNITLYFLIQQILKGKDKKIDFQELCIEIEQYLENDGGLESSILRLLRDMVEWGVINRCFEDKKALYILNNDFSRDLTHDELLDRYEAVGFFKNIKYPSVPGHYLKDTIKKYIAYNRQEKIDEKDTFLYRFNNIHIVLEEEIVWSLLIAINNSLEVEINYKTKRKEVIKASRLEPIKVICDVKYGIWFLIAKSNYENLSVYKVENIKKVSFLEIGWHIIKSKKNLMRLT